MVYGKQTLVRIFNPIFIAVFYIFLYLPIFILILFSFNDAQMSVRWAGFSLKWYKKLFFTPEILEALGVSLVVAISSTFLSVFMGTLLVFASKWWKPRFLFKIFYINIMLPEIIIALGLLSFFAFFRIELGYARSPSSKNTRCNKT
jgi:spermidine/putrescine transport system permease protein